MPGGSPPVLSCCEGSGSRSVVSLGRWPAHYLSMASVRTEKGIIGRRPKSEQICRPQLQDRCGNNSSGLWHSCRCHKNVRMLEKLDVPAICKHTRSAASCYQ